MNSLNQIIKICAVIPFYNEKDFILDVVTETLNYVDKVIAVNDGSTDSSEKVIANLERVQVISSDQNYGKGHALRIGFDESIKQRFDVIITLDADKQHKPEYIPALLSSLRDFDIIIGNRLNNLENMPVQRIMSNKITSLFLSFKTGQKIVDSQCGYRAYKSEVIKNVTTYSNGYEAESEEIIFAARLGYKIGFVQIPTVYGAEKSKMNAVEAIKGFLKILFK